MDPSDLQEWGRQCVDIYDEEISPFRNEEGELMRIEIAEYPLNRTVVRILNIRKELKWVVQDLDDQNTDISDLRENLDIINSEIGELRRVIGSEFDETLKNRLGDYYDSYPRDVCKMFEFEPIENETPNMIDRRDSLQVLWEDLAVDDPIIQEGMSVLDETLKCKFKQNESLVRNLGISRPYYPSRYWWRHPEQVLGDG